MFLDLENVGAIVFIDARVNFLDSIKYSLNIVWLISWGYLSPTLDSRV